MRDPIPFSERLSALLAARKPEGGQAWLAKTTGLEPSTVSRLLRGERQPAIETLELLAPALGTTVEDLVRGTNVADRARTGPEFVPLEQFQQAVAKLLEYEQKANDAEARLADARRTLDEEVKQGKTARAALRDAEENLAAAQQKIIELDEDVERYKTALHNAVADIWQLKAHVADIEEIARSGNRTGRATAVLAAIAAVTGAATVSYYVKNTNKRPKPKGARKPKKS